MSGTKRTEAFDQPNRLLIKTQELLKEDDRDIPTIFAESRIPLYWLQRFAAGQYQNPSVNRVQYLYEFLSGKELDL